MFEGLETHKFRVGENKYLLDVSGGALLKIDQLIWDILDQRQLSTQEEIINRLEHTYTRQQIEEGIEELRDLISESVLTTEAAPIISRGCNAGGDVVKALCLHAAHDCNLRCHYCFACDGNFGGVKNLMSFEVGKKAIDFLLEQSGNRHNCEVDFFGGEPLLNFSTIKEIVAYGQEAAASLGKNIRFTLTTNAVLLTQEVQDYLNEQEFSVVLSLDGRQAVNDRVRVDGKNNGTYHTIINNIVPFVEKRNHTNYYVRGTYTKYNLDFSADVAHLADLGFKQISVEPVVGTSNNPYSLKEEDLPQIFAEYERLTELFLQYHGTDKQFSFFHFNLDLEHGPCLPRRVVGCGAGYEYLSVTPEGELYPCHQFVGREEFKIGSVFSGLDNRNLREQFKQSNIYSKEDCTECWARYYCSGGCHANAHLFNGTILEPDQIGCKITKKRLECALAVQGELRGRF